MAPPSRRAHNIPKAKQGTSKHKAARIPPIVEQVRQDMGDSWRHDDKLLDKFFPADSNSLNYKRAREELFNSHLERWKGISASPGGLSRVYTPLTNLMNRILFHYGISRAERLFMNTHDRTRRPTLASPIVSPGIFLSGLGDEFASLYADRPRAVYPAGIAAFEVLLDSEDLVAARNRLAVHMHHIFQDQSNRRFAYGLVITPNIFILYMFDHSGAVASEPCNYHACPDRFCAVVSGLAAKGERIGFDITMFGEGPYIKIRTFERKDDGSETQRQYTIQEELFQFPSLVGRGTMCWLTVGPDDSDYVVKDAWVAPSELAGRESEGSLLRHAQARGVVTGIAQIRHFEEIRRGADASDSDTILRNRQVEDTSSEAKKLERIHTRIVMATSRL